MAKNEIKPNLESQRDVSKNNDQEKQLIISSFEDLNSYLLELQRDASYSIESAINAQLAVIQYIQTPSLVTTTLDTLILNLKKSLKSRKKNISKLVSF